MGWGGVEAGLARTLWVQCWTNVTCAFQVWSVSISSFFFSLRYSGFAEFWGGGRWKRSWCDHQGCFSSQHSEDVTLEAQHASQSPSVSLPRRPLFLHISIVPVLYPPLHYSFIHIHQSTHKKKTKTFHSICYNHSEHPEINTALFNTPPPSPAVF